MSTQEHQPATALGTCIYCDDPTAAGTRVCARHQARLHDEDVRTGGGPR